MLDTGSRTAAAPRAATTARGRLRRFVPPQHGAWAMVLVPYLAGVLPAPAGAHVLLLVAALAGWSCSYYAGLAVKARRWRRFRPQVLTYALAAAAAAAAVAVLRPSVLTFAPVYALLAGANLLACRLRRDRSLLNDLALVTQGALLAPVAATCAARADGRAWAAAAVVGVAFAGSVLHVKTMIRNRGDRRYLVASLALHLGACVVAAAAGRALLPAALLLALRAVVLPAAGPHRAPSVRTVGLVEVAAALVTLEAALAV